MYCKGNPFSQNKRINQHLFGYLAGFRLVIWLDSVWLFGIVFLHQ
jgi:hypothetical protein